MGIFASSHGVWVAIRPCIGGLDRIGTLYPPWNILNRIVLCYIVLDHILLSPKVFLSTQDPSADCSLDVRSGKGFGRLRPEVQPAKMEVAVVTFLLHTSHSNVMTSTSINCQVFLLFIGDTHRPPVQSWHQTSAVR